MKRTNLTRDDKRAINHMIRNAINDNMPPPAQDSHGAGNEMTETGQFTYEESGNETGNDSSVGTGALFGARRFRRRMDTPELCSAEFRGHSIDCTAHWRRDGVWHCMVRNKAGELVAEHTHYGHNRPAMLEESARKAELLPNPEVRHGGANDGKL